MADVPASILWENLATRLWKHSREPWFILRIKFGGMPALHHLYWALVWELTRLISHTLFSFLLVVQFADQLLNVIDDTLGDLDVLLVCLSFILCILLQFGSWWCLGVLACSLHYGNSLLNHAFIPRPHLHILHKRVLVVKHEDLVGSILQGFAFSLRKVLFRLLRLSQSSALGIRQACSSIQPALVLYHWVVSFLWVRWWMVQIVGHCFSYELLKAWVCYLVAYLILFQGLRRCTQLILGQDWVLSRIDLINFGVTEMFLF